MPAPIPNGRYSVIWCLDCAAPVSAELVSGKEVYPHRSDLHSLPFWRCPICSNYVGCHKSDVPQPFRPLGPIPTPEIRKARQHLHTLFDPIWQSGVISRTELYERVSTLMEQEFHIASIRSLEEGRKAYRIIQQLRKELHLQQSPQQQTEKP